MVDDVVTGIVLINEIRFRFLFDTSASHLSLANHFLVCIVYIGYGERGCLVGLRS